MARGIREIFVALFALGVVSVSSANAAIVTVTNEPLALGNPIGIQVDDYLGGVFTVEDEFMKVASVTTTRFRASLDEDNGEPPLVRDLFVFFSTMGGADFDANQFASQQLTDGAGLPITGSSEQVIFTIDLPDMLETVFIRFTGDAELIAGVSPDVNIIATVVPVPAALPLLLTGFAGLTFASRRRRRSVTAAA